MALLASPLLLPTITTPAAAACSGGASIVCDTTAPNPHPTLIGGGSGPEGDNTSVEIRAGATVDTGNGVAISLRDNANIRVLDGGTVQARSVDANGPFNTGGNTIEFRDNGVLTVERGGSVLSLGTEYRAEAVNLQGTGSLVVNDGLIRADNAAAIWIQSFSGLNTIVNNATGIIQSPGTAIGFQYPDNDPGGVGNAAVDFTNRGLVIGNVILANGDDNLRLYTGSSITGLISGGDGYDRVFLNGTGSGSIAGAFPQFEELTKADSGTWTLTSPLSGVGLVRVQQGTLALTGDNSAYAGQTLVERAGILEANALSLPLAVVNDGLVRFVQPTGGTYAGLISGLGWVEKTGAGTLFLAPASGGNTYGGGTILTGGTLAIGADSALGAPGAALVFNGGTIRFGDNLTLAPSRAVSILAPGGTIDTAGFRSVIAQGITGSGGLAITGGGVLVLSGANTYTGGTTIGTGTLQLGNGGTTGSLVGDVANAGTLAFNRADTATFAGVVSGTGALRQDGTGTTVLTGANTYTGATRVGAGILRAGGVGVFSAGSAVEVRPGAELDLAGSAQTVGGLANAGLVSMGGLPGNTLTVAGNLVGQGGTIAMNTVLGGDSSATDRVVIQGGTATGDTVLRINNAGGSGAQTVNGIRLVETVAGGTTSADAFRLGNRVAAGAYEYQLSRGGVGGANDWYLRSFTQQPPVVDSPTTPVGDDPVGPGSSPPPVLIPLYRPEVALYAPIPALARQMATFTLGTLHERVGDEENIRDLRSSTNLANGGWARAFGERVRNRWDGTVDSRAEGNLIAVQAGFDVLRYQSPSGHRDHAGFYVAYSDYNASSVSGFSLGQRNADVGRLLIKGPAVGAYWTHFGPTGWYVDAVVQGNWYDVKATSNADQQLNTDGTGVTASVEAGYPISLGQSWKLEPQAQVIWQQVSIGASRDGLSSVSWDEGQAVMGRIGARLQYTVRDALTLWQPYAKVNLWHGFSGTDRTRFGASDTVDNRFGDTSIEVGAGVTARITRTTSLYAHADYRRTIDDGRSWQDAVQGSLGIRVNW